MSCAVITGYARFDSDRYYDEPEREPEEAVELPPTPDWLRFWIDAAEGRGFLRLEQARPRPVYSKGKS